MKLHLQFLFSAYGMQIKLSDPAPSDNGHMYLCEKWVWVNSVARESTQAYVFTRGDSGIVYCL